MFSLPTTVHDPAASAAGDDEVIRLREWGTDRAHPLPLIERGVSLRHAELIHERGQWHIRDLASTTELRQGGEPRKEFVLTPGVEVGIGPITLIAESQRSIALREFCARMLGWGGDRVRVVDHALRALRLAAARRSALVLRGEGDLVPLAHALHRRVLGPDAPFVVCDRRREDLPASVRSPANRGSGVAAFKVASGGSLCVLSFRLPRDQPEVLRLVEEPDSRVQLIVCMRSHARGRLLTYPRPIEVPPLGVRRAELPRIIQAYADDAIVALHASPSCFSQDDHDWVMKHDARSLSDIEKATFRIVALKMSDSICQATKVLGMTAVSLSHWLRRRKPLTRSRAAGRTTRKSPD